MTTLNILCDQIGFTLSWWSNPFRSKSHNNLCPFPTRSPRLRSRWWKNCIRCNLPAMPIHWVGLHTRPCNLDKPYKWSFHEPWYHAQVYVFQNKDHPRYSYNIKYDSFWYLIILISNNVKQWIYQKSFPNHLNLFHDSHPGNYADEASGSFGFPGNAALFLAAFWACAGSAAGRGRGFQEGAQLKSSEVVWKLAISSKVRWLNM